MGDVKSVKTTKGKVYHNNDKALWENDDGTEMYLMPGTPAYEEYLESLRKQSSFRPEDEAHIEWEEHNEDVAQERTRLYRLDKSKETARRKYIQRMRKSTMAKRAERLVESDLHRDVSRAEFMDEICDDGVIGSTFYKEALVDFKAEHDRRVAEQKREKHNGRDLPYMKSKQVEEDDYAYNRLMAKRGL